MKSLFLSAFLLAAAAMSTLAFAGTKAPADGSCCQPGAACCEAGAACCK